MGRTQLSGRELRRAEAFGRVASGSFTLKQACEFLELSDREGRRLWQRYRGDGAAGLQHGLCGRESNRAHTARFRTAVLKRVAERYAELGPTLASEHLAAYDGLVVARETLRRWLQASGQPAVHERRAYRKRQERKKYFGELVRMDSSFHRWLGDRAGEGFLMQLVDDATGTALFSFAQEETTWAAADLLRAWIDRYGVPRALYTDWKNVYMRAATEAERLRGVEPVSQFGRMCVRLGIRIVAANSPQAKGPLERARDSHQEHLVKKLRLAGIGSYVAANSFLDESYIAEHNRLFTSTASSAVDLHRRPPYKRDLDKVFQLEQERVVSVDWVISYQGRLLQLMQPGRSHVPMKSRVLVRENQAGELQIEYCGHQIHFRGIPQKSF